MPPIQSKLQGKVIRRQTEVVSNVLLRDGVVKRGFNWQSDF
jgi:hypothetical protein